MRTDLSGPRKMLEELKHRQEPCILCAGPCEFVALFVPDNPQRFGALPGKTRVIGYSLCNACASMEDKNELSIMVENKILVRVTAPMN